ncbi:antibiotic biosynthesis monooxygenase family protein [Kribbella sp. CA-247076]|uniref:antibiotic biosynthesis monooxygenase family protein n=1 Tax=Kribbella sp. CA-247076 TaxID=3239941 RepID=UPI003D8E20A4
MPHVLVRQRFEEFEKWKKGFESLAATRAEAGCRSTNVFRNRQDPHEVVVLFEFDDLERAVQHMKSDALRAAWQEAGVTDPGTKDVLDAVSVDV